MPVAVNECDMELGIHHARYIQNTVLGMQYAVSVMKKKWLNFTNQKVRGEYENVGGGGL